MNNLCKTICLTGLTIVTLSQSAQGWAQQMDPIVTPTSMRFTSDVRTRLYGTGDKLGSYAIPYGANDILWGQPTSQVQDWGPNEDALQANGFFMQSFTFPITNLASDSGSIRFRHGASVLCNTSDCMGDNPSLIYPGGSYAFSDTWSYTFTANMDANFRFDYDLRTSAGGITNVPAPDGGGTFEFRNPFGVMLFGPNGCIACDGAVNGSGSFDYALLAGQSYTFNLSSFSNLLLDAGTRDFYPRFGDDLFSYNITAIAAPAVPEPAIWAMMIAGFGMVGAGMRRRKVTPALA